jgi:YidC/Oxa1 family membrane protein insertase
MLQKDLRRDICPDINPPGRANPVPCGDGGDAQFFFIPDITNKATGTVLIVLIVLYVGSQLFSTLLMSTTTDRNQKILFIALPFFFVIFIWQFPAGLLVYWITTNIWTIVQQAIVRKRLGPIRPPETGDAVPAGATSGGIAGRLRPAAAGASSSSATGTRSGSATKESEHRAARPPAPPRKKKKRSGRRR